ncbi:7282_t:CDS:2, partial [Racocetra fulgida]
MPNKRKQRKNTQTALCEKNNLQCNFIQGSKRGPKKGIRKRRQKLPETDASLQVQQNLTNKYTQQSFRPHVYTLPQQTSVVQPNLTNINFYNVQPNSTNTNTYNFQQNSTNIDTYNDNHYHLNMTQPNSSDINNHHFHPTLTNAVYILDPAQPQPNFAAFNNYHTRSNLTYSRNSLVGNHCTWQIPDQTFCQQMIYGDYLYYDRKQDNLLVHGGSYSFESPTDNKFIMSQLATRPIDK